MTDQTTAKLRELLLNEFSEPELEQLCQDIGLNYAALPGTGTFGKTRELVEMARSQDKLRLLQSRLRELRPAAYAAANIQVVQPIESTAATNSPTSVRLTPARSDIKQASWLPILAIGLIAVLCVAAIAALVLNRPSGTPIAVVGTSTPAQAAAGQAGETPTPANPTVTTDSAQSAAPTIAVVEASPAVSAAPVTADVSATTAPLASPTVIAAAATPTAAEVTTVTVATAAPTIAAAVTATGTLAANQAHPAALVIRDLNEQLPKFYLGAVTSEDLQKYWAGEAWRSVVGFGTTKLPRVMRVPPAQRGTLDVTYNYVQLPTLQSQRGGVSVVTAREFWKYVNAANAIEICEVRDYVYNVIDDSGSLKVRNFTSRLLQSGCPK